MSEHTVQSYTPDQLVEMYLDWYNNYLTLSVFAYDHNISEYQANRIIDAGRMYNHTYTQEEPKL